MNSSLRILHCLETIDPAYGGPVEAARQFAIFSSASGVVMEIATLDDDVRKWEEGWPVPVHALGRGISSYRYNTAFDAWMRQRASDYDAVVVHGIWGYHTVGTWRALVGARTPYFVIPHGMLNPWLKAAYPLKHLKKTVFWHAVVRRALKGAAAVVFLCEEEPILAQETFSTLSLNQAIAPLGISSFPQEREAQVSKFFEVCPEARGKRIILFLGRICLMKGCDLLIEAFARVASLDPELFLVIAGPDEDLWQSALIDRADKLGIGPRVLWPGPLYGDCKWGAQHYAEMFALPSHCETFPVAVLEALACSTPVLITEKVNIWREIDNDGAAIVRSNTVEGVVDALSAWIKLNPSQRAGYRSRAFRCYSTRFEISKAMDAHVALYRRYLTADVAR